MIEWLAIMNECRKLWIIIWFGSLISHIHFLTDDIEPDKGARLADSDYSHRLSHHSCLQNGEIVELLGEY